MTIRLIELQQRSAIEADKTQDRLATMIFFLSSIFMLININIIKYIHVNNYKYYIIRIIQVLIYIFFKY